MVEAKSIKTVDYLTAMSKTEKSIAINQSKKQQQISITVQKIELADNQTRLYLQVYNQSHESIYFEYHATTLLADGQKITKNYAGSDTLSTIQAIIDSHEISEGVVMFDNIDFATANLLFSVFIRDSSTEQPLQYQFDIHLKQALK